MRIISDLLRRLGRQPTGDAPSRLPSPDALVLLARPNGEPEAQMLRQILEQNGVRAMVKNRDAASAQAGGMGPPWAYELWVLRKDLRRARELLDLDDQAEIR
jgi:hypothetical protein